MTGARVLIIALGVMLGAALDSQAQTRPPDRAAAMQTFADSFFRREMANMGVPGAAIVLVEGGQVVMKRGYGLADVASRRPVDADATAFRLGSVGKTFTALAVLQQVEAGRLDLDRPVSTWVGDLRSLDDKVTLRRLLLHTAGLDERLIGYQTRAGEPYPALREHLAARLPAVHANPEALPAYSNYGYALAGLAVERVSKRPFRTQVESAVLRPLGMAHSFYALPPSDPRMRALATEYTASGKIQPLAFTNPYPAGGLASTAGDMGGFIQALLAARAGAAVPAISPAVARAMTSRQLEYAPGLEGEGFGLNEQRLGGRAVWMKGGAAPKHSAVIVLLPHRNAGLFIALNRQEPTLWNRFLPQFLAAFYPQDPITPAAAPSPEQVEGVYELARASHSSIEKLTRSLFQVTVAASGPDTVILSARLGDLPGGTFRRAGGAYRSADRFVAFRPGAGPASSMLASLSGDHFGFRRVSWWERFEVQAVAAGAAVLLVLAFPLVRLVAAVWRRLRRRPANPDMGSRFRAGHALALAGAGLGGAALAVLAQAKDLIYGPTPSLYLLSGAAVVFAAMSLWLTWSALRAAVSPRGGLAGRLHLATTAAAGLLLSAMLAWYNVLTFSF